MTRIRIPRASIRDVAAYLLDRAGQYETESPCWVALSDAAHNIAIGEVAKAKANGELLHGDVYERVDSMISRFTASGFTIPPKPVDPKAGIYDDGD